MRASLYPQVIQVFLVAPAIWTSYCAKLSAHQKLPILGLILHNRIPFDDNWETAGNKVS